MTFPLKQAQCWPVGPGVQAPCSEKADPQDLCKSNELNAKIMKSIADKTVQLRIFMPWLYALTHARCLKHLSEIPNLHT
jgi:hypothetical protein